MVVRQHLRLLFTSNFSSLTSRGAVTPLLSWMILEIKSLSSELTQRSSLFLQKSSGASRTEVVPAVPSDSWGSVYSPVFLFLPRSNTCWIGLNIAKGKYRQKVLFGVVENNITSTFIVISPWWILQDFWAVVYLATVCWSWNYKKWLSHLFKNGFSLPCISNMHLPFHSHTLPKSFVCH